MSLDAYDYIVAGAGSAGCVLANRLSADPGTTVLLLEAGGRDRSPMIFIPKGFYYLPDKVKKQYETTPFGPNKQTEVWGRGRVLGGSSSINGLHYNRGFAADFDAIADLGNPGWGWDNILPIYRQMEDHSLGASDTRGEGGPLGVSVPTRTEAVCEAMIGAGAQMGWKRVDDVNASDDERIGYAPSSTKRGTRVSTARAFLRPVRGRKNLHVLTDTELTDLVFDGTRVTGVRCKSKAGVREYRAKGEVILSMGSFESPLTLERAGIGRGDVLRAAGIDLRIESPQVGEKMREHRAVGMQARLKPNLGYNSQIRSKLSQGWTGAKYLASRQGVISQPAYDLAAYFKADETSDRPQLQAFLSPLSVEKPGESEVQHSKLIPEREAGLNFLTYALRPTSVGSVHVTGSAPDDVPAVDPNYLATQEDRDITAKGFLKMRELLECSPLSELVEFESVPGKSVSTIEQIEQEILLNGSTGYHALGTCAMGPNDDDVVDADLRVRGVQGLRVVDASVFPTMVSGNCNAPTIAFAWRAADLIKAQAR